MHVAAVLAKAEGRGVNRISRTRFTLQSSLSPLRDGVGARSTKVLGYYAGAHARDSDDDRLGVELTNAEAHALFVEGAPLRGADGTITKTDLQRA